MTASASCSLRASASASRLGIGEQQDRALAAREGRQRLGERDRVAPPTLHFERGAAADVALRKRGRCGRSSADMLPGRFGPAAVARGRAPRRGAGSPTAARAPRISRASRSAANTTQPIRVGAMIGAATSWRGRPASTATPVRRPASSGSHSAAASRSPNRRIDRRNLPVGGDDEGGADLEPRRGIAERRLHRRLVAGGDRGAEAEVARQQLRRVLQLVRALLPQPVVDRAARLQLAFDLARGRRRR